MNTKLSREIYGQPWFIDISTIQTLTNTLIDIKNGIKYEDKEKSNNYKLLEISNKSIVIDRVSKIDRDSENKYISLISLDGPITKHGGTSHYGTLELAQQLRKFDKDQQIIGHILFIESGGGSATAVAEMTDAIQDLEKPIVTFVDGIMASAAMYIGAFTDYIISHRQDDLIGSVGTLIQFSGYPKVSNDNNDGFRVVRVYADASINKNKEFEEAINNLNFKPVIEKILNPTNDRFINDMKKQRPNVRNIELTGEIFEAQEVVGTLIDEIGPFNLAVNKVLELSQSNINNNNMNKEELKSKHPEVYNEIYKDGENAGISKERDRVQAYLAFNDIDPEAVKEGVDSGKEITQKFMAEMTRKQLSTQSLEEAKKEATPELGGKGKEKVIETATAEEREYNREVLKSAGIKTEDK